ncbi:MAG: hypothetical protein HS132_15270 [Planctomycetia bacterium]|nr:hypothetical protein [Planctomycetia bacterium]
MNKINKALACIQIVIFLSLTLLCSSETTISSFKKSDTFPCKDHACGCKSEADCKAHCCCSPQENQTTSQYDIKRQKNSFQSFISSLKCKSGSGAITCINAELTYILDDYCVIPQIPFFCFLASDTLTHLCEVMVSPPKKPPRCHA